MAEWWERKGLKRKTGGGNFSAWGIPGTRAWKLGTMVVGVRSGQNGGKIGGSMGKPRDRDMRAERKMVTLKRIGTTGSNNWI